MSDDVTHRNILAIKDYSQETRAMVREDAALIAALSQQVMDLKNQMMQMQRQIGQLQVKLYSGGATE